MSCEDHQWVLGTWVPLVVADKTYYSFRVCRACGAYQINFFRNAAESEWKPEGTWPEAVGLSILDVQKLFADKMAAGEY